jgi:hypothetical protein
MSVRMPLPASAAKILHRALRNKGLAVTDTQALDLVARVYGYNSWYALAKGPLAQHRSALKETSPHSFDLHHSATGCRIRIRTAIVEITQDEKKVHVRLLSQFSPTELGYAGVSYEEAAKNPDKPDPTKLFHGCVPFYGAKAVEMLEEDGTARRLPIIEFDETALEWLQEGAVDFSMKGDWSDAVMRYKDKGTKKITTAELDEAELAPDGLFTFKDGRRLYLLDEKLRRWAPIARI